ncbi:MAG TPA: L,D-transpeptidase [Steroidobacteraceae bacterium]
MIPDFTVCTVSFHEQKHAAGAIAVCADALITHDRDFSPVRSLLVLPWRTSGIVSIMQIIVRKEARRLVVLVDGREEGSHPVTLGRNWAADKAVEGDEATPLGEFYICAKNPRSKFFLSLCISYPNAEDAERGLEADLITPAEHTAILDATARRAMPPQNTRLGGQIYIHGEDPRAAAPAGALVSSGTRGCIALQNSAMQELFDRTALGTLVIITR